MIELPSGVLAPAGAVIDPGHPLASVLQHVWTGDAPANGRDRMRGAVAGVHANATRHGTPQGLALLGNGTSTGGTSSLVSIINRYPFTLVGYGYFNNASGAWQLGQFIAAGGGTVARIAIASSTTVALDLRYNFGTQRQIAVTLPTAIATPICMIAHMTSATDYWLVANGQVALGTLTPGTLNNLDRYFNLADTFNGGMWLQGVGQGVPLSLDYAIEASTEPRRELAKLFRRRIWVPVSAGGTVHDVDLTEAFSSGDAAASALMAAAAATESITAAETLAAVMSAVATLTEAASATDAQVAARAQASAANEAATATDAQDATLTAARSVTEAASATDLAAAVALAVAAVSEAISATDAQSTSPIVAAALTEAASAADSASVLATLAAVLSESAAAADAITAAALLVSTLIESANAADAATTAAQLVALLTESASLADAQSTGGGTAHNVSIDELALALDLVAAALADVIPGTPRYTITARARRLKLTAAPRRLEIS